MNTNDVKLNGLTLDELSAFNKKVQQEASKIVAELIQEGSTIIKNLNIEEQGDEAISTIEENAGKALDILKLANRVAEVSGVTYDIGYNDMWGYSEGEVLSKIVEEVYEERTEYMHHTQKHKIFDKLTDLLGLLEDMENNVSDWNSSSC